MPNGLLFWSLVSAFCIGNHSLKYRDLCCCGRFASVSLVVDSPRADLVDARMRIAALEIREAALLETVATESNRAAAAETDVHRLRESEARALERERALKRDLARLAQTEAELRERTRSQVNSPERGVAPPMATSAVKVSYTDMASPAVLARVGSAPIRGGDVGTDVGSGEWIARGAVSDVVPSPPRKPPPRRQSSRPRADLLRRASSFAAAASKRHDAAADTGADGLGSGGGGGSNSGQAERVEQLPHFPEPVPPIRTLSSPR